MKCLCGYMQSTDMDGGKGADGHRSKTGEHREGNRLKGE